MGTTAKGRSSSLALSRVLRGSLGYILGSGLYMGNLHCRSAWNRADDPSRDRDVQPPTRDVPRRLLQLQEGDYSVFDKVLTSAKFINPVGRWIRMLLLLSGPESKQYVPRGRLQMNVGFAGDQSAHGQLHGRLRGMVA